MTAAAPVRRDEVQRQRRGVTINLRAPAYLRDLIDKAAAVIGQNRSEFMLDSARRRAEDILLDQTLFVLDEARYKAFINLLDEPPRPTEELKKLLAKKAPWEK
jgi:uncharacterized protein (DUF1778 family)